MRPEHEAWISQYAATHPIAGCCHEACLAMRMAFPELRLVRGWVELYGSDVRTHWWLADVQGVVVDPTVDQFKASHGVWRYLELGPDTPEPIGKCIFCGDFIAPGGPLPHCSDRCTRLHAQFLNSVLGGPVAL